MSQNESETSIGKWTGRGVLAVTTLVVISSVWVESTRRVSSVNSLQPPQTPVPDTAANVPQKAPIKVATQVSLPDRRANFSPRLMSVRAFCEGDNPVVEIENFLVGGESGSGSDALILSEVTSNSPQVLAILGITGVRDDRSLEDRSRLTFREGVFPPDAKYTDMKVSPFPIRGGERYWLERKRVEGTSWDGNKRVLRLKEYAKAGEAIKIPLCF